MRAPEYNWIALDVETVPRDDAAQWFPPVEPDGRLTNADRIAADIAKKEAAQRDKAAVDWNLNRIVVLGYQTESMDEPSVRVCDGLEAGALKHVWEITRGGSTTRTIISFNGIRFDVPTMVQRSRYLGVTVPHLSFRKWDNPYVRDLYMELTFDDAPCTHIMERSLDNFCKQFGIHIPDDVYGSMVPGLVAAGQIDRVVEHCRRDVMKTVALAKATGAVYDHSLHRSLAATG